MQYIGKYKILKKLGSGSFGFVYLAEDPKLHVQVAIKVFKVKDATLLSQVTSVSIDPESVLKQRFIEEARTLRKLATNPYIVQMYEFDELEDGTPYYVMPFIQHTLVDEIGKDAFSQGALAELPQEHHPRRIATTQAINYLKQLTQALCFVHQHGLVHRDIKPANILINDQNQVQLSDFGIAKLPLSEHSQTGFGMGSKNYMSPEQQESAKHVKPASDIYSLGVLAYRMLTGQLPVGRFQDPIEYAPEIGQPLNDLILLAISQSVAQRPDDGTKFLDALNQAIASQENSQPFTSDDNGSDEDTAVWVSQSSSQIKPELTPLENKIVALLIKQGEIKATDLPLLQALGDINHLDNSGLKTFIEHIIQQQSANSSELQSFILWVNTVNKQLSAGSKISSNADMNILMEVGLSTTNKTAEQLKALLETKQQEYLGASRHKQTNFFANKLLKIRWIKSLLSKNILVKDKPPKTLLSLGLLVIAITVLMVIYGQYNNHENAINNDKQAWTQAKNSNTTQGYNAYLQKIPKGNYIDEAKKSLAGLLLKEKILTASKVSLRQQQITNAQRQLIKHGFQLDLNGKLDIRTKHAIETFEKNENLFITGNVDELLLKKLAEIHQKKESLLWQKVQQEHSIAGYQKYHLTFPQGLHVNQAINAIKQLNIETKKIEKQKQQSQEKKRQEVIERAINELLNNLVTLPSGKFSMGCNQGVECKEREIPLHTVFIKSFRVMATEVTFTLWDACVISGDCSIQPKDEGWARGNRPVIGISYLDIVEQFIPWLNKTTGEVFSLPSEAQWEYAAKAGSNAKYAWGNEIDCLKAHFSQFSGICGNDRKTSVVKSFTPNEFGLYDMYGNVWEWTQDCWHHNYLGAPNDGSAWTNGNGNCDAGVIRGGSWLNQASFLRSAFRSRYSRSTRSNANGFRLVINTK
ncbi:MAG: bifunctional serine/threonine-protein kinase/formylglycine-generating enzyme family protein [Colwellia sp.]|nr:bifunctional serine/threonine-protein kinase/formylglycine-generating enzyme family protein [Colwellia sp.]